MESEFFSALPEKYIIRVSRFLLPSLFLFHEPLYHEQIGKLRGVTSLQGGEGGGRSGVEQIQNAMNLLRCR